MESKLSELEKKVVDLEEKLNTLRGMYSDVLNKPRTKTLKEADIDVTLSIVQHNMKVNNYGMCVLIKRSDSDFIAVLSQFDKDRMP